MKTVIILYAVLSIVFGILIIIFPNILSWLVGLYLILAGLLSIFRLV